MLKYLCFFTCVLLNSLSTTLATPSEFDQWMQGQVTEFQEYKDKRDREFTQFLKSQWKEMQVYQGLIRDKTPKPINIPVAPLPSKQVVPPDDTKTEPVVTVVKPIIKPTLEPPRPEPASTPVQQPPADAKPLDLAVTVSFFGQSLRFYYDKHHFYRFSTSFNKKAISDAWSKLSLADYEQLLNQLEQYRKSLALNDWANLLLIHQLSKAIYKTSTQQTLFTWFYLVKQGYQARIGFDRSHLYLLLPSQQQLFATPYFTFDNIRYYAILLDHAESKPGRIFTYDGQYPGARTHFNMQLSDSLNFAREESQRKLTFQYDKQRHVISVNYNKHIIHFLQTYPQLDISLYFSSPFDHQTSTPLLQQLAPLVEGKTEEQAVNLLLRFVQSSFDYKTDELQFGIENYLFPEETLHYPYSDCEDRSVFFAWLVRNLLKLEVIGLDYPGHIATAVQFHQPLKGDAIIYEGKRYTVADPTFINASAGMTMPQYKKTQPAVIPILN